MDLLGTAAHWFGRGGFVMYILLLASLGAVSLIIERAKYYRHHHQNLHRFLRRWQQQTKTHSLPELAAIYRREHGSLSRLAAAGCLAAVDGRNAELAIEGAAQLEAAKLKRGLPLLGCLVTLSPILGLMGTVTGMIQSFSIFNVQAGAAPMAITGGVGEALVATVSGLGVAVIALLGDSWFGYRLDIAVTNMEQFGTVLAEDLPRLAAGHGIREQGKCEHEAA